MGDKICTECNAPIPKTVYDYSTEKYDKALCMFCQRKQNGNTIEKYMDVKKEEVKESAEKKENGNLPMGLSPKNVITLHGKSYITHEGLLELGHKQGMTGITTKLLTVADAETIVIHAVVRMGDNEYSGIGDANQSNVSQNIAPHRIRMAETRAVNRALRFATGVGMTSAEELGDEK